MSRFLKNATFPILIVVVLAFFAQRFLGQNESKPKPNFGQFLTQVKAGDVKSVTLNTRDNTLNVTEADGKTKYETGYPDNFEPQLIDFGNSTDWDCYQNGLYYVVGRSLAQRDLNQDGGQDLFGPVSENGAFARIQSYGARIWPLDSLTANYQVPALSWAQYGRFVTVQDQDWYTLVASSPQVVNAFSGAQSTYLGSAPIARSINHIVERDGKEVHEIGGYSATTYRGVTTPITLNVVNDNVIVSQTCVDGLPSVSPAFREVAGTIPDTSN